MNYIVDEEFSNIGSWGDSDIGKEFEESGKMAEKSLPVVNEQFNRLDEDFKQCANISLSGQRCVLRAGHAPNFDSNDFNGRSHNYGPNNIN